MDVDTLVNYWALVIAAFLAAGISLFVGARLYAVSVRGRLGANVRELRQQYKDLVKAAHRVGRVAKRLEKLERRANSVKPRRLKQARGAVDDAKALQRIIEDKVLIAENRVRKLIVEEYPPKRQERLRERLLRRPEHGGLPFTFG